MKCNSCGAEIGSNKVCQFCGSQITYSMKREQEQLNKRGCPQCSSSNIEFSRESQGEVRGNNAKQILHRTVGFCKDCGYTWYPSVDNVNIVYNTPISSEINSRVASYGNSNMKWWVLGWIFFFPAPVMVLIWRKKNTWDIKVKIAVTIIFWLVLLAISASADKNGNSSGGRRSSNEQKDEAVLLIEADCGYILFDGGNEKAGYSVIDRTIFL